MSDKKYKFAEGADPFKSIERTSPAAFAVMVENGYIEEVETEEGWFKCGDVFEIVKTGAKIILSVSGDKITFLWRRLHSVDVFFKCNFQLNAIRYVDILELSMKTFGTDDIKYVGHSEIRVFEDK